jgi:ribosomal protein L40E
MEGQQFKFCMNCGMRIPADDKFCTNCGAKLPTDTSDIQRPGMNTALQGNNDNEKVAQYELMLGRNCLNGVGVQKNYEQAVIHLKKAASLGNNEAPVLIAVAYMYQAIDILQGTKNLPAADKFSASCNNGHQTLNNNGQLNNIRNNTAKNNNSTGNKIGTVGKYAAVAAAGAIAGTLLHNNTSANSRTYQVPSYGPGEQPQPAPLYDNPVQENNDETYNNEVPAEDNNSINDQQDDYAGEEDSYGNAGDFADSADDSDSSFFDSDDGDLF